MAKQYEEKMYRVESMLCEFNQINGCFSNVWKQVKACGGKPVFGWLKTDLIFESKPRIQIWVHHCVWENENGKLWEITPQIDLASHRAILRNFVIFIPDEKATLIEVDVGTFMSLPAIYEPLVKNGVVRSAIKYLEDADKSLSKGDLNGEAWNLRQAGMLLGGEIDPLGELGLRTMVPFKLEC